MKGGFKKFSSRIGRWFSGDSEEFDLDFDIPDDDQPPPEEDKPPTAGGTLRGPPPDQLAALEASLTKLALSGMSQVAGKVQLLRFDGLRERLGEKWAELGTRIDAIIQRSIRRFLAEKDIFSPFGDYGYLIVFAGFTRDEAAMKCALIREEILKQLLGEDISSEEIVIETAVATVEGKIKLRPLEGLDTLFERIQEREGKPAEAAEPDHEPRLVEEAGHAPRGPTWGGGATGVEEEARDPEWRADKADLKAIQARLKGLKTVFRPIWDVRSNAEVACAAVPARRPATGEAVLGDAVIDEFEGVARLAMDLEMLRQTLPGMANRPAGSRVIATIHFDSLATVRNRRALAAACGGIPADHRPALMFELVGLPEGIPNDRLSDMVSALGKFGGGVIVRCPMTWTDFARFTGMKVDWVGFAPDAMGMDENRMMDAMQGLIGGVEAAGLPAYALGLPSRNMAMAAIGFGIRFLGGAVTASIGERPEALRRFDLETAHGTRLIS
jgi:hypothetical protein